MPRLVTVLHGTDPQTPVWTFHPPDRTVASWRRRMTHGTAVHRVDAESAHGEPAPVPAPLVAEATQ